MNINDTKARLNQAQARISQGRHVAAVEVATDELGDLIEAWDLLFKIADQHQNENPISAARECLLCDARDMVQGHLKSVKAG